MIRKLAIILLLISAAALGALQDRDIYPLSDRKYYRPVSGPHIGDPISPGGDGSIMFWNGTAWVGSDVNELEWDPNTLTVTDANVTGELTVSGLTASRLTATNANKLLVSIADLTAWVAGTTDQLIVTADGDGTITLSLPQDVNTTSSPTFAGVTVTDTVDTASLSLSFTEGSVVFSNGTILTEDNSNLFFDDTNDLLGIGTATPVAELHIVDGGHAGTAAQIRIEADTNGQSSILFMNDGTGFNVGHDSTGTGTHDFFIYDNEGTAYNLKINGDLITLYNSLTVATGKNITLGTTPWNTSDEINGEYIADDTIDNDSIDWADMTDLDTDGAVVWGNLGSGELTDSAVVLADLASAVYAKDLVTTSPVTGAADNIFVGADSDVTVALDFTTAWNFGSAAGSEWVNDGAPTTDAAGEIALDTTIIDHQPLWQYYDGGENMSIIAIDTAELPAADNEIVKYDAATDKFVLEADAIGGATAYDDIGDPDAASSITFADGETVTWATAEDSAGSFFTIDNSDADLAANTYLMHLTYSVDDDQANADYFKCEDAGGVVFTIQQDGDTVTAGDFQAATLTDGIASLSGGALTGLTTALTVAQGGTGATSLNDGFVLLGSGVGAVTPLDVTTDGGIIIGDGTTDPVVLDVGSSTGITILGTIATGVWQGTAIADGYIPNNITIDLATLATTVTITDNESTAENNPIVFVAGADPDGGSLGLETDGTCYYTPSTGVITTTGFVGALTGAVTGNASTATALETPRAIGGVNFDGTAAITPTTIIVADTTDTAAYIGIWEDATGSLLPKTDGAATYNAGTGTITATEFAGGGGSLTAIDAATGDSATAFFDAGTIEHEYGGIEADISAIAAAVAFGDCRSAHPTD